MLRNEGGGAFSVVDPESIGIFAIPTEYVLEAGGFSGSSNVAFAATGSLSRSLSASAPPGTYYVRVKARNAAGIGPPSNEVVIQIAGPVATQAPVGLSFFTSGQFVRLSWVHRRPDPRRRRISSKPDRNPARRTSGRSTWAS